MATYKAAFLASAVLLLLVTFTLAQDHVPGTTTDAGTGGEGGASVDHVPGTRGNAGGGTPAAASSVDHVPGTATNAGDNRDSGTSTDHVPGTSTNAGGSNAAMTYQVPVKMAKLLAAAGVFGVMLF